MTREQAAELLGLGDAASRSDILHAFSRNARLTHPDLLADPTPEAIRAANERFIQLTTARDLLLSAPAPGGSTTSAARAASTAPDAEDAQPDDAEEPERSPRVAYAYQGPGRRKPHGMGSSIATVIALALVLVSVVSWQDAWRIDLLGAAERDLTAETVVTAVTDPLADRAGCADSGACVVLDLTTPEDCVSASARFEVTPTGSGEPTTETRELSGVRAGVPVVVAFPGRRAELLFLGCGE
ncbi:J domain-containing protein [Planctomonas deserti]|uniref:J domain-containing protein n=1 Tax=Planctomonas deserti TaxID=2144185 RepID=UPI000D378079|nr:J domain-containing protein [Planctomonas deserti]